MLQSLSIRNIVLIDHLDINIEAGLCVLTGETGAGKSILLDALGFVLGERSNAKLLRHGETKGSVSALFNVASHVEIHHLLDELAIEIEQDELHLRRVIDANGKSRAFINDIAVNVSSLKRVGLFLLEIHGQHEQSGLLSSIYHRDVLDAFGAVSDKKQHVALCYRAYQELSEKLEHLERNKEEAAKEESYLRFVVNELEKLAPKLGEEAELAATRERLMHREKTEEAVARALETLSGEVDVAQILQSVQSSLMGASEYVPKLGEVIEMLERAAIETGEAVNALEEISSHVDEEETTLDHVEERLFALRAVARKYGVEVDELGEYLQSMQEKLALISDGELSSEALKAQCEKAKQAFLDKAKILSEARKSAAKRLEKRVMEELAGLKMQQTQFAVSIEMLGEQYWSENGIDNIQFMASTNKGTPIAPIAKIASGGELSRFMLALKVALAGVKSVPTLVFDEVDTGIGGAVADAVGRRLAVLGKEAQVLVVTHQPQVASKGQYHLKVKKESKQDQTFTRVAVLAQEERKEELARMLAGEEITHEARAAASKLLQLEEV